MNGDEYSGGRVLATVLLVGVVGFAVANFTAIGPMSFLRGGEAVIMITVAFTIMLAHGLLAGFLWRNSTWKLFGIIGLATIIVAIMAICFFQAISFVTEGGIPPVPPATLDTRIGWFTPRFWSVVIPAGFWTIATLIPYGLGVSLVYRHKH